MRKFFSFLLVLATLLSLTACGESQTEAPQTTAPTTPAIHEHSYTSAVTEATCEAAGYTTFTCSCGHSYTQDEVAATGHSFGEWETTLAPTETATGLAQRSCTTCLTAETRVLGMLIPDHTHNYTAKVTTAPSCTADGEQTMTCACGESYVEKLSALGHNYGTDRKCTRCKAVDPSQPTGPVKYTVNVRGDNNALSGVTVTLYANDTQVGTAVTDNKGAAKLEMPQSLGSYKVTLSNVPEGFAVNDTYSFSSTTANINLKSVPVLDLNDHSKAKYTVGSTMANFVLTDTDGNVYDLEQLRKQNKLIILDFWYVNCSPCKKEFPYFEKMLQKYGDDVILLAINNLDSEANIKALREELNADASTAVSFPMIKDTLGITQGFGVSMYPVTVFIDPSGKIVYIHKEAFSSETAFISQVEKYLK